MDNVNVTDPMEIPMCFISFIPPRVVCDDDLPTHSAELNASTGMVAGVNVAMASTGMVAAVKVAPKSLALNYYRTVGCE